MFLGLNADQWYSILRQILLAFGGIAVTKGWIAADSLTEIVGGVMMFVSSILSLVFHRADGNSLVAPPK